jgi:hypothetical protein
LVKARLGAIVGIQDKAAKADAKTFGSSGCHTHSTSDAINATINANTKESLLALSENTKEILSTYLYSAWKKTMHLAALVADGICSLHLTAVHRYQ